MPQENIALLGFGDIATRLAKRLTCANVTGVKRTPVDLPLSDIDCNMAWADCRNQQQMNDLMSQHGFDVVVMTFTPAEMSDQGYQAGYVDTVKTVIHAVKQQAHQPRLLLFVSSSSVYGQKDASWVDEASPTKPSHFSGKRLLEAEALLKNSGYPYCCVRFSGIYGPGRRRLIEQVIAGKGAPAEPILYSNRIHSEDCAGVLEHLIQYSKTHPIENTYLATDFEPAPLYDVKQWIAQTLGFSQDHLQANAPSSILRSSKRCSNQRLLETGYQFLYPTYREGYAPLLDDIKA